MSCVKSRPEVSYAAAGPEELQVFGLMDEFHK